MIHSRGAARGESGGCVRALFVRAEVVVEGFEADAALEAARRVGRPTSHLESQIFQHSVDDREFRKHREHRSYVAFTDTRSIVFAAEMESLRRALENDGESDARRRQSLQLARAVPLPAEQTPRAVPVTCPFPQRERYFFPLCQKKKYLSLVFFPESLRSLGNDQYRCSIVQSL